MELLRIVRMLKREHLMIVEVDAIPVTPVTALKE